MITREDIQSWLDRLEGGSLDGRPRSSRTCGSPARRTAPRWWCTTRRRWSSSGCGSWSCRPSEPRRSELFRQLLEFNARDLVHGSYGLEGDHVVLTDTLELENLDYSEFEASFDSITLALASHLGALAPYRER